MPATTATSEPISEGTQAPEATQATAEPTQLVSIEPSIAPTLEPTVPQTPEVTEETTEEPTEEITPQPLFQSGYAKIYANTTIYKTRSSSNPLGKLNHDGYVYVMERFGNGDAGDWVCFSVAVNENGSKSMQTAYLHLNALSPVDALQVSAVVNEIKGLGSVINYQGDAQRPLSAISFTSEKIAEPTAQPIERTELENIYGKVLVAHAVVYSQPDMTASQLGLLAQDEHLPLIAQVDAVGNKWYEINYHGVTGYVLHSQICLIVVSEDDDQIDATFLLATDATDGGGQIDISVSLEPIAMPSLETPLPFGVQLVYQTVDGEVLGNQQITDYISGSDIVLSDLPAGYSVVGIVDGSGMDLMIGYLAADATLALTNLQADVDMYITVEPIPDRFIVLPYFEKAAFGGEGDRFEVGTPTGEFSTLMDVASIASQVVLPEGVESLNAFIYNVNEASVSTEDGVLVYSILYMRKPATQTIVELDTVKADYFEDGMLLYERELIFEESSTIVSLLEEDDSFKILSVTTEEGVELDFDNGVVDAVGYGLLNVNISTIALDDNHADGIAVFYQLEDGTVIAAEELMINTEVAAVQFSSVLAHYVVTAITDDANTADLMPQYDAANRSLVLLDGRLITELYVTIAPSYEGFIIMPYFQKAEYTLEDDQFETGIPTEAFALDIDLETATQLVTLPEGEESLDAFRIELDEVAAPDVVDGIATYAVYYQRQDMVMLLSDVDAEETRMISLEYYDISDLTVKLFTRSFKCDAAVTTIDLLRSGDTFDIVNVTDADDKEFIYDATEKTINVENLIDGSKLKVYVDSQPFTVTVYYSAADGKMIESEYFAKTANNISIELKKVPKYYKVVSISDNKGNSNLIEKYNENVLTLGKLSANAVIYVTLEPDYDKFAILPYYEDINGDYLEGTQTTEYPKSTNINTIVAQIISGQTDIFSYTNDDIKPGEIIDGVATYHVYYSRKSYLFSFDASGGLLTGEFDYAQKLLVGEALPKTEGSTIPNRPGYLFKGWTYHKASDINTEISITSMPTYNVVAKAKWEATEVKVRIDYYYQDTPEVHGVASTNYSLYYSRDDADIIALAGSVITMNANGDIDLPLVSGSKTILNSERKDYQYFSNLDDRNAKLIADGIEVAGDGTTVVTVYVNRDKYTIHFHMEMYKYPRTTTRYAKMDICGKPYNMTSPKVYVLEAYFGEDVLNLWPAGSNIENAIINNPSGGGTLTPGECTFAGWNLISKTCNWLGDIPQDVDDSVFHNTMDKSIVSTYGLSNNSAVNAYALVKKSTFLANKFTLTMYVEDYDYNKTSTIEHESKRYTLVGNAKVSYLGTFSESQVDAIEGHVNPTGRFFIEVEKSSGLFEKTYDYSIYYNKIRYTLKFDANGGLFKDTTYTVSNEVLTKELVKESNVILRYPDTIQYGAELKHYGFSQSGGDENIQPVPTRDGYKFLGWYPSKTSESKVDWKKLIPLAGEADTVTYYAKWAKESYKVTFHDTLNGNAQMGSDFAVEYMDTISSEDEPDTDKEHYRFIGWYIQSDQGEKLTYTSGLSIRSDLHIYGEWEWISTGMVNYEVQYVDANDQSKLLSPTTSGAGKDGEEITLYPVGIQGYITTEVSKTVVLKQDEGNPITIIIFEYIAKPNTQSPQYSILCMDNMGKSLDDQDISIWNDGEWIKYQPGDPLDSNSDDDWIISINAPKIAGYKPIVATINQALLSDDKSKNIFTFEYIHLGDIKYEVHYLLDDGTEKPILNSEIKIGAESYDVTAEAETAAVQEEFSALPGDLRYEFTRSMIKQAGMGDAEEYPVLTLCQDDMTASELPYMKLYFQANGFSTQPQSQLIKINEAVNITAELTGTVGSHMQVVLYKADSDGTLIEIPLNKDDIILDKQDKTTNLTISLPEATTKDAAKYYIEVHGERSNPFVISTWELKYARDDGALDTSEVNDKTSSNDTAQLVLTSGYPADSGVTYAFEKHGNGSNTEMTVGYGDSAVNTILNSRNTATQDTANKTIALNKTVATGAQSTWNLDLYNYNKITKDNETTVDFQITIADIPAEYNPATLVATVSVKVNIHKYNPTQINVSVPLVLVAQMNIDGGLVETGAGAYAISNLGESAVNVVSINAKVDNGFQLVSNQTDVNLASATKEVFVQLTTSPAVANTPFVLKNDTELSADIEIPKDSTLPIAWKAVFAPFDFVTKQEANVGLKVLTVTYTVALPK